MATMREILRRRFENYKLDPSTDKEIIIASEIVKDFACKFVLYLDSIGVDEKFNLNQALEIFEKHYEKSTDISGNERNL